MKLNQKAQMKIASSAPDQINNSNKAAAEKAQQDGPAIGIASTRPNESLFAALQPRSPREHPPPKRRLSIESAWAHASAGRPAKRRGPMVATRAQLEGILSRHAQGPKADDDRFDFAAALAEAGYAHKLSGLTFSDDGPLSLQNASVIGIDFEHCTFGWNALSDARFSRCSWEDCTFDNTSFGQATLSQCLFQTGHFTNAMFVGTCLDGVVFHDGKFTDCSFEDATIANSTFEACTLRGTHFLNSSISNSKIRTSNIKDTFLAGATGRGFDMDSQTKGTQGATRAAVVTLVAPGSRGVSVPRVGAKLSNVGQVTSLRVAMQSPKLAPDQINGEVERLLGCLASGETTTLSIAQQLLTLADEDRQANPGIATIVDKARAMVAQTDAVVLPGGEDVPPRLYGSNEGAHTNWGGDYRRSILELALIREALKKGLPLMAICRGFQMANVYFGATLLQHIGDEQKGVRRLPAAAKRDGGAGLYGDALNNLQTAVYHHQAVPSGQESLQYLEPSVIRNNWVMAVESIYPGAAPVIGVQFHPEFFDSAKAAKLELSDERLVELSRTARTSGNGDPGLRDPADLVNSGVIQYMSRNNDKLWALLSDAANTYRLRKNVVREDALREQKARLRKSPTRVASTDREHAVRLQVGKNAKRYLAIPAQPLKRVVKNNPDRMPMARTQPADAMAHIDAIGPSRALYRTLADGKDDGVALLQRHNLGP